MKYWIILFSIFSLSACSFTKTVCLTKEEKMTFNGYTLIYRGIDKNKYNLYVLVKEYDSNPDPVFFILHAYYKNNNDYSLAVSESSTAEVDTPEVLAVLSTAYQYKIREIYPIKDHMIEVYFFKEKKPIYISLD